jgi:hypothetical protein
VHRARGGALRRCAVAPHATVLASSAAGRQRVGGGVGGAAGRGGRARDQRRLAPTPTPQAPQVQQGSVALAFGLVLAAGAATALGASLVFCASLTNRRLLSGALGASAGVMVYVSFVEIFSSKAVEAFEAAGFAANAAARYATLCFFAGAVATWALDHGVHFLVRVSEARGARAEAGAKRRAAERAAAGALGVGAEAAPPPRLYGGGSGAAAAAAATAAGARGGAKLCAAAPAPMDVEAGRDAAAAEPPAGQAARRGLGACGECGGPLLRASCGPPSHGHGHVHGHSHGAPLAIPKDEDPELRALLEVRGLGEGGGLPFWAGHNSGAPAHFREGLGLHAPTHAASAVRRRPPPAFRRDPSPRLTTTRASRAWACCLRWQWASTTSLRASQPSSQRLRGGGEAGG